MKERQHLLEFLYTLIDCSYLSDLHQKILYPEIYRILRFLEPGDFPLKEWNQACNYILGKKEYSFLSSQEAYEYLCNAVSEKRGWKWHESV